MGKIAIFVGSHCRWSQAVVDEVEEFCQRHDAIVIGDHTSNYHGKHWANVHLATHQREHLFAIDVDLLIHVGDVSGATITMLKTKEVWRVSEDGAIVDTFRKLRYVFEMSENDFFKRLNQQEQPQLKKDSSFLQVCKEEREKDCGDDERDYSQRKHLRPFAEKFLYGAPQHPAPVERICRQKVDN